jgi:zinc-ribbon domain
MSEPGYCARCGEQVRPGNAFCVSCGASLTPQSAETGRTDPGSINSEKGSPLGGPLVDLRRGAERLEEALSGLSGSGIRRWPRRIAEWYGGLPRTPKLIYVGTPALILVALLSQLTLVVAALVLVVSVVALMVRVARGGSVRGWATVAAASLVITLASYGSYNALHDEGNTGGSSPDAGRGLGSGHRMLSSAGSFEDPADMRLCLGGEGPEDYSGPALDFKVVDSREAETRSGVRGLALMVGTSVYEDLDAIAQNLAVDPDGYDAVEVTIFPREWAFYTPSQGLTPLPGAPSPYATTYYVAHSAAGEAVLGLGQKHLDECGSSYEDGGYKWGTRSLY